MGAGTARRAPAGSRGPAPSAAATYGYTDVGKPPHLWGGYAEHMYLSPHSVLKKMNPKIPAGVAVMFNSLAAGLSWAGLPRTGPGDRVVILGAGQRGLCCVIGARAMGARQVVITGLSRDAQKLALVRELSADATCEVPRRKTWWRACADTPSHRRAEGPRRREPSTRSIRPARELPVDDVTTTS